MTGLFQAIAAITSPYGVLPETADDFHECEHCGCYTDRTGCRAVSNCCGATKLGETDLCSDCMEHAEFECEEGGCDD